jgi:demethylmenaquinone methyltransferase/2-methoxy-6-polyprenyl-1,4-benzoquinol methylase
MSEKVKKMFANISSKYDVLNDILSFGMHRIWKNKFVKMASPDENSKILDIATGTGDIAFKFYELTCGKAIITGMDFTSEMILIAEKRKHERNISFIVGDALNLPFDDNIFDINTISFGIRNVDDVKKSLTEMARVLKTGGRAAVLEFGQARKPFAYIYNFYSKYIMPFLGKFISGDDVAYTYLPETASQFPSGDNFVQIMKSTNCFSNIIVKELLFGVAYIYIGLKSDLKK